jgi:hypothetical protein
MRAAALEASVPGTVTRNARIHGVPDVAKGALSTWHVLRATQHPTLGRGYTAGAELALEQAGPAGWTAVSVRDDWATVF